MSLLLQSLCSSASLTAVFKLIFCFLLCFIIPFHFIPSYSSFASSTLSSVHVLFTFPLYTILLFLPLIHTFLCPCSIHLSTLYHPTLPSSHPHLPLSMFYSPFHFIPSYSSFPSSTPSSVHVLFTFPLYTILLFLPLIHTFLCPCSIHLSTLYHPTLPSPHPHLPLSMFYSPFLQ